MDSAITTFRNFASSKNIHVTLVIHPRKVRKFRFFLTKKRTTLAKIAQDNLLVAPPSPTTWDGGRRLLASMFVAPILFDIIVDAKFHCPSGSINFVSVISSPGFGTVRIDRGYSCLRPHKIVDFEHSLHKSITRGASGKVV